VLYLKLSLKFKAYKDNHFIIFIGDRMKKYLTLGLFVALVFSMGFVLAAKPDFQAATVTNPVTGEPKNTVTLPPTAIQVAPNIFYLGTAIDKGRVVEGYAFVDYRKGFGKPGTECGNDICEPGENAKKCPADCAGGGNGETDTSSCYGFLARGAKWKTIENYIVNPANTEGLTDNFVMSNLAMDIDKWETAADANILGTGSKTSETLEADFYETDDKNEVYFGDVSQPGAIAVAVVWGIFSGPPRARELVEWDMIFDQADFDWSDSGAAGKMDFENIATHELGHSVGLDDLYDSKCSEMTMYGYADYGETNKRTLEDGDIAGVKKLYS